MRMLRTTVPIHAALLAVVATAIGLAGVVSACGESDEQQVRATFGAMGAATEARDYEALCDLLTADARRHVGQIGHTGTRGCPSDVRQVVTAVLAAQPEYRPPAIASISIDGSRAVANLRGPDGESLEVPLAVEDGDWRVDSLYGGVPASTQEDRFR